MDFGPVGEGVDPATGEARRAWLPVMVLGYGRHRCAREVFDPSVRTWIDGHIRAFAVFGGAPRALVPAALSARGVRPDVPLRPHADLRPSGADPRGRHAWAG